MNCNTNTKGQQTRQANASKRKEKDNERKREENILRQRLVAIIDDKTTTNTDALEAIRLLWTLDEQTRYYH